MINLVELNVLAEEYKKEVESLLSNAYYIANHKKDAWAKIKASYEKLATEFDGMLDGARAKTNALYRSAAELKESIGKALKDEDDVSTQWAAELNLKKIEALEALLQKIEITVVVKAEEIIFYQGDDDVLTMPLRQSLDSGHSKKAVEGNHGAIDKQNQHRP